MIHLECAKIWGGNEDTDTSLETGAIRAALFASSCDGGKGGDVYYFSVCGEDRLTRVALADVVGHGEPVSAIGAWLYEAVAARVNSVEGNGILSELNLLAVEKGYHAMATASVLALHRERRELYYSNAGHPPLWLFSRRHGTWEPLEVSGEAAHANLPLGVFDDAEYPQAVRGVEPGDWILAFTDGVTEAANVEGAMFGLQGLLEVMKQHPCQDSQCLKGAILEALRKHTGGALEHDDVTLIILEVQ